MGKKLITLLMATFILLFLAFFLFVLVDRGDDYPTLNRMEWNLTKKRYSISVIPSLDSYGGGECLSGEKNGEYIEFYWLENSAYIPTVINLLEKRYASSSIVVIPAESDHNPSLVYSGTSAALAAAGIK